MKGFVFILVVVTMVGCGGQAEMSEGSCTEMVTDLYSIPNCALWDISTNPPTRLTASQSLMSCRLTVATVNSKCSQCGNLLNEYLNCRPTKCEWNEQFQFPVADDCNDELDRLSSCCL
jgi:hypothetical protein